MSKHRIEAWFALGVAAIGLLLAGILGLGWFMSATATQLHPVVTEVASVTDSTPAPRWSRAVDEARRIVRTHLNEQNLPGVSVAVGVADEIVWAEGFGWANLEQKKQVTPATRFRIGTASTVLTSAGVGRLLEQGRLELDEEIQTYVPEFARKKWPVTLRQLMGHVGGVRNDGGDEGPLFAVQCGRPVDAFPYFANRELLFEPGTRFHYSSYGWIVVSAALEAASGEPFVRFMRKEVFEPLEMDETETESAAQSSGDLAISYFPRFGADPRYGLQLMRDVDHSCYAGASVFVSTPSDLVRFAIAVDNGKLLQPATLQRLQTPQRLASGEDTGYGLGWDLETATISGQPVTIVGHDGDLLGGMAASLMILRERGIAVAAISNISYADTYGLALKIAQAFADAQGSPTPR